MDKNRMKGMLWGLIVGDAFGSPIQFSSKDDHPWITEMVACPVFDLPPGYWTDDGAMALAVMDAYLRKGEYDLVEIGNAFVRWLEKGDYSSVEGQAFDIGKATYKSVKAIKHGSLVNGDESSQGNGSIMRFAPGYLIARALGLPGIIHEISDLTHCSSKVRAVCDRFALILDDHMDGLRTTKRSIYSTREEVNNSGWAVSTLEAALWAFDSTATFADGLIAAVNLGGDSDSIGAVYGQIAGAYYGFDAIPKRWVKAVTKHGAVDSYIKRFIKAIEEGQKNRSSFLRPW